MKKITLNYQGTFIKELRIASYVIAAIALISAIIILASDYGHSYRMTDDEIAAKWVYAISILVSGVFFAIIGMVVAFIAESALVQKAKAEIELYKMGYEPENDSFFLSADAMNELIKSE